MFDISKVDFRNRAETSEQKLAKVQNPWFINAHHKLISTVEMVEQRTDDLPSEDSDDAAIELPEGLAPEDPIPWPDIFVLTGS